MLESRADESDRMQFLPVTDRAVVLRTDYSDDDAWRSLAAAIEAPVGDFMAMVTFVSDPQYEGTTAENLAALLPPGWNRSFIFLADKLSFTHPDHPILVLDLSDSPYRSFRVIPSEMWGVENNLSLANMDFFEFADSVQQDGIFRGFE
jgi:hypothetical protein